MAQTFSQRKGLKPTPDALQVDSMNSALRNCIWNVLDDAFWRNERSPLPEDKNRIKAFGKHLWKDFLKLPVDNVVRSNAANIMANIRKYYFEREWNEVYDFIEYTARYLESNYRGQSDIHDKLNAVLESELSAYRFINKKLADITSEQEVEMLEEALSDNEFAGVSIHLTRAFELYADRENPDYRNSIKESISAIESMAKILTGKPKATLEDALKALEKDEKLHRALRDGFGKLYAYTNDANGIRHSLQEESNLTAADAKYFLLSCTSFVNYLKSKM
jgi:hypothetical protein